MNKVFEDYCNQKFNIDYLCIITASNSTFRAFHKDETYKINSPAKIFRSWMNKFLVNINSINLNNFDEVYNVAFDDFSNYWRKHSGVKIKEEKVYLFYKLMDLFFKHAFLYNNMNRELSEVIMKNTMPPLDSLVLISMLSENEVLKVNNELILNAIPAKPTMGNVPKNNAEINNYLDFRKECHRFFYEWAFKNKTYPLCYDILAWNSSSSVLRFID